MNHITSTLDCPPQNQSTIIDNIVNKQIVPLDNNSIIIENTVNKQYKWGANFRVIGKTNPQNLSGPWAWQTQTGTLADLAAHLSKGHPFMPSLLNGNHRREQQNANYATMLALDIDEGLTIADALSHPFIVEHCGLAIETTSSKPEHHKFRLIFPLAIAIEGHANIKTATLYLQHLVGSADKACSDASRFYFGSLGRSPFLLQEVSLPANFLEQAQAWQAENDRFKAEQRAERERVRREAQERIRANGNADLVALVEQANDRLGFDAFLPYLEHQGEQDGKYRCKPMFRSGSGSYSAFVAEKDGKITYQDPTAGHGCDGFRFYVWMQRGEGYKPTGKDFVTLAKEYLAIAGIDVPQPTRTIAPTSTAPDTGSNFLAWVKEKAQKSAHSFQEMMKAYRKVELPSAFKWEDGDPVPTPADYEGKEPPQINFRKGSNVAELIAKLKKAGWLSVVDMSLTGEGKTHRAGSLRFDTTTWYIDTNHNNPSVKAIAENYANLWPRHTGLWKDEQGNLTRKPIEGAEPEIRSNCPSANLFPLLGSKNYPVNGKNNPICGVCPHRAYCGTDNNFFKFQRHESLLSQQIRADIQSLPAHDEWDYSADLAIIEEATLLSRGCIKTTSSSLGEFLALLNKVKRSTPHIYQALEPLETAIAQLCESDKAKTQFGLNHGEVMEQLPQVPEIDMEVINTALFPELKLDEADGVRGLTMGLSKTARTHFAREAREENQKSIESLPSNLLVPLLEVLAGGPGSISIVKNFITITRPDERKRSTIQAMGFRIFLDATGNTKAIEAGFGLPQGSTITIAQEMPDLANLTVFQTEIKGLKTRNRSDSAKKRIAAYVSHQKALHPDIQILGFKGEDGISGWWGNHNRGTNKFKGVQHLLSVGIPYPNIGAIQAEYRCFFGTLEGFDDYYKALVRDEIIQWVGRQRIQHYPDVQFHLDMLATWDGIDLDFLNDRLGVKVVKRHAVFVCADAGTTAEQIEHRIFEIAQEVGTVTQEAIASALGISQQAFSKHLKALHGNWFRLKKQIQLFLKSTKGKVVRPGGEDPSYESPYLLASLLEALHLEDYPTFDDFWDDLPPKEQAFYIGNLLALC